MNNDLMFTEKAQWGFLMCSRCKQKQPTDEFWVRSDSPRGYSSRCKRCESIIGKERRDKNLSNKRKTALKHITNQNKPCTKCHIVYPLTSEYFEPYKRMRTGYSSWCRNCKREAAKEYKRNQRNCTDGKRAIAESMKKHKKTAKFSLTKKRHSDISNHRRRQREMNLAWNWGINEWESCKESWGNSCANCGKEEKLTQDHFIPLCDPNCPGTVPHNIVPACSFCNCSKSGRDPYEWASDEALLKIEVYFKLLATE